MKYDIEMSGISHRGNVREKNEDNLYFGGCILDLEHGNMAEPLVSRISTEGIVPVAVFDGMGGENAGEVASHAAAEEFSHICQIPAMEKPYVLHMVEELNRAVCAKAKRERLGQIGCTATILIFHLQYAYLINVGDSPAFIFRNGKLKQISRKHTDEELLRRSNAQMRKPALTQYLGIPEEEMLLEPYLVGLEMKAGDIFLVCSDGLTDMVSEMEICAVLEQNKETRQMTNDLLERTLMAGGRDNTTIICCKAFPAKGSIQAELLL